MPYQNGNPQISPPASTISSLRHAAHWTVADGRHEAVSAAAALVGLFLVWKTAAWAARRVRGAIALLRTADDGREPMDPFTAAVTGLALFLSVDGMWTVFGGAMHLPTPVRVVTCSVMEASEFAFMRLARADILAKRSATHHTAIVWCVAVLSGTLSAAASASILEAVIRLALPILAVQLCHAWMLPIPTEITLDKLQKGRRAWRFVRAQRRLDRAGNRATRWTAEHLLALESNRLAKRSLMTGDASAVLEAAERISIGEALAALGIDPSAPVERTPRPKRTTERELPPGVVSLGEAIDEVIDALGIDPSAPAERTTEPERTAERENRLRDENALRTAALAINDQAIKATGKPASARLLASELRLGHKRAGEILKWVQAQP